MALTKVQQQKVRRFRKKEAFLTARLDAFPCDYRDLMNLEEAELDAFVKLIGKVKVSKKSLEVIVGEGLIERGSVLDEPIAVDDGLLDYLKGEYKGISSKKLKYANENRGKFKRALFEKHQTMICTPVIDNTIRAFYDSIDISDFIPSDRQYFAESRAKASAWDDKVDGPGPGDDSGFNL